MKRWLCVLPFTIFFAGCGSGMGELKGTVTFQNKPLQAGTVTVIASDGKMLQANIASNGEYELRDVPLGKAKFYVYVHNEKVDRYVADLAAKKGSAGSKSGRGAAVTGGSSSSTSSKAPTGNLIPARYADHSKEILTHNVTSGENVYHIKLVK